MRRHFLALVLLSFGAQCTAAQQSCASPAACNQAGTAAYQAGRHAEAIAAFERQLKQAEQAEDRAAQELALNNLMLANLKATHAGMARAWLRLALRNDFDGAASRHNLAKVGEADVSSLGAVVEGHYLRYAGQAAWSSLQIRREGDGYRADFAPIRVGGRDPEEWGPAAIGELQGRLQGAGDYFELQGAGLAAECKVQLLRDGLRLQVLEVFADACQEYGGAGISVAGEYFKVEPR
ncbi:tetratricopeptide repeat protein [Aquipseudomonas alcaligenes]|uniref:tetratricopeptide repeat protein n=1 Tax=Aquipseudomonas alcaligenes TaxID=43263 RepID=UPI00374A2744